MTTKEALRWWFCAIKAREPGSRFPKAGDTFVDPLGQAFTVLRAYTVAPANGGKRRFIEWGSFCWVCGVGYKFTKLQKATCLRTRCDECVRREPRFMRRAANNFEINAGEEKLVSESPLQNRLLAAIEQEFCVLGRWPRGQLLIDRLANAESQAAGKRDTRRQRVKEALSRLVRKGKLPADVVND